MNGNVQSCLLVTDSLHLKTVKFSLLGGRTFPLDVIVLRVVVLVDVDGQLLDEVGEFTRKSERGIDISLESQYFFRCSTRILA